MPVKKTNDNKIAMYNPECVPVDAADQIAKDIVAQFYEKIGAKRVILLYETSEYGGWTASGDDSELYGLVKRISFELERRLKDSVS